MSTLNACDYAYPASNVAIADFARALAAAGITVVQRYLFDGGKGITTAERKALLAAGIGIVYGYEGYASNWRGGTAQGDTDAHAALACLQRIGVKPSRHIVVMMAVDEDAAGFGMLPIAKAYVNGAHAVLRAAGFGGAAPYGSNKVLDYVGRYGFQTYAWSGGIVSKWAALYQWLNGQHLAGATVDYGEVTNADKLGAEWPEGSPHKEPNVTLINAIRVLRAIVLGGKYATPALQKKYPRLVRKIGVRAEVDGLLERVALLEKPTHTAHKPVEHKGAKP